MLTIRFREGPDIQWAALFYKIALPTRIDICLTNALEYAVDIKPSEVSLQHLGAPPQLTAQTEPQKSALDENAVQPLFGWVSEIHKFNIVKSLVPLR
jgi:hypothetical protein